MRAVLLLTILLVTSCKAIEIPDSEWCGDMGPDGAACYHTLSDAERVEVKASWDTEREGMICTQSSTFASWKAIIEKLCHETKDCSYAQVEKFLVKATANPKKH